MARLSILRNWGWSFTLKIQDENSALHNTRKHRRIQPTDGATESRCGNTHLLLRVVEFLLLRALDYREKELAGFAHKHIYVHIHREIYDEDCFTRQWRLKSPVLSTHLPSGGQGMMEA